METEFRALPVEVRADERDGKIVLRGIGIAYNTDSQDLGGFIESFAPGAFADDLGAGRNVVSLFNHDANFVLGSTGSGTVRLSDDETALRYEIDVPDSGTIRDLVAEPIRRGDIGGSSFQFRTIEDKWDTRDGVDHRTVVKAEIREVGPVTFPAYLSSDVTVAARSLSEWKGQDDGNDGDTETPEPIAALYRKIENGDELTTEERRLVARYIDDMTAALAQGSSDAAPVLDYRRERLRLLEIAL